MSHDVALQMSFFVDFQFFGTFGTILSSNTSGQLLVDVGEIIVLLTFVPSTYNSVTEEDSATRLKAP